MVSGSNLDYFTLTSVVVSWKQCFSWFWFNFCSKHTKFIPTSEFSDGTPSYLSDWVMWLIVSGIDLFDIWPDNSFVDSREFVPAPILIDGRWSTIWKFRGRNKLFVFGTKLKSKSWFIPTQTNFHECFPLFALFMCCNTSTEIYVISLQMFEWGKVQSPVTV